MLGKKGRERYNERSEESADFTLSSLALLDEPGTFADLKGFAPIQRYIPSFSMMTEDKRIVSTRSFYLMNLKLFET